jgi:hypothetical protein
MCYDVWMYTEEGTIKLIKEKTPKISYFW